MLSYESDGLPTEYLGSLLVTSWADHRIERYVLKERGSSFTSERLPFVQGGKDFRPVGLAVAPDGSLYVTDWVLKDYTLHGKGAVWHIRWKEGSHPDRPTDPKLALASRHRPLRCYRVQATFRLATKFANATIAAVFKTTNVKAASPARAIGPIFTRASPIRLNP